MCGDGYISHLGNGRFEWIIDDFFSAISSYGHLLSPSFSFDGEICALECINSGDWIKLGFRVETKYDCGEYGGYFEMDPPSFHVKLGMNTGYRGSQETRSGMYGISIRMFEPMDWIPFSEMLQRKCEILPDGRLTIYCELRCLDVNEQESKLQEISPCQTEAPGKKEAADNDSYSEESALQSKSQTKAPGKKEAADNDSYNEESALQSKSQIKAPGKKEASDSDSDSEELSLQSKSAKKVLKGLKNLLTSAEESDVVIKIEGKEFPAHRAILRMRSPVFNSMFSHETVEKETGVVDIEDCDPLTFPDFLSHVYTGSTKHICAENMLSLYTASDKYCMEELKEACALFMKNNFSVDTFCDVTALALRHSDDQLIKSATKFFCEAATEIIKTPKWHKFLHENTIAGNELFDKALSNSKIM